MHTAAPHLTSAQSRARARARALFPDASGPSPRTQPAQPATGAHLAHAASDTGARLSPPQAPRLTGVQIAKFVRWAASAHSWYKHVPLQDAAVFSFVLDLTVGMKRTSEGFIEQHEGDARTHYSWLPTQAYREAFGLLTYRDALPAFQPECASGPRSVSVQRHDARRVWVPSHLVEVGSCRITAACHGRAEAYQIYHHAYDAFCQARLSGSMAQPKPPPKRRAPAAVDFSSVKPFASEGAPGTASAFHSDLPATRHSYSYLSKHAQREAVDTLPPEVMPRRPPPPSSQPQPPAPPLASRTASRVSSGARLSRAGGVRLRDAPRV